MEEQDPVPTPRMHWTRLVLGRGHPIIIIVVLAAVGAAICWFSLQKISFLTQTPTRYEMGLEVATEGCDDRKLAMFGDIGSFGLSFLEFRFFDDDGRPMFVGGCWLRSIVLRSNLPLQPVRFFGDSLELIGVTGTDPTNYANQETSDTEPNSWRDGLETFRAIVVDGDLRAVKRPESTESGPSSSMRIEHDADVRQRRIYYKVVFQEQWQPILFTTLFVVPENVRTYFDLFGMQVEERVVESQDGSGRGDGSGTTPGFLDMSVSFRTDEVLLVRGLMSDSGDAMSVDGYLRFGIENSDAESRRESGNVRYSAILGIGIALLVEAFVILLALGMRALASRLGVGDKPAVPQE